MKHLPLFSVSTFLLLATSTWAQDAKPAATVTIELFNKGFNLLAAAAGKTDLAEVLNGAGAITVFAPNDAAFRDLPKAQLDALLVDKEKLTTLLKGHIVEGKLASSDLRPTKLKTLAGTTIEVTVVDGKIRVGGATLVKPDVRASNGVIHGINKILQP